MRAAQGITYLTGPALGFLVLSLLPASAANAGDKALGEYLSSECVTCHQVSGRHQGIPPIIGWPEEAFIEIINAYRRKQRDNPVMQLIASRLTDEEVAALAAYFGGLSAAGGVK